MIGGSVGFRTRSSSDVVTAQVPEFSGVVWFAAESSFGAHVGAGLAFIVPQTEDLVAVVDLQPSFLLYYAVRVFSKGYILFVYLLGGGWVSALVPCASAPWRVPAGVTPSSCVVVAPVVLVGTAGALAFLLAERDVVGWLSHQGLGVEDLSKGLGSAIVVPKVGGLSLCAGCPVL